MCRATVLRLLLPALALLACSDDTRISGNSTSTGNAQASGRIFLPSGKPASSAWVQCSPDSLAPWDARLPGWTSLTDSSGRYRCTDLPSGRIGIASFDPGSGLSHWQEDTVSPSTRTESGPDTLALSGRLRIAMPPGTNGTLHFSGLTRSIAIHGETEIEITDLPAGWRGTVKFASSFQRSSVVDTGVRIAPGSIDSAGYSRHNSLLRIPLAGNLRTALANVPILVRLDSSWDGFWHTFPDGSDLRLSTTTGKPLPLTIVTWDRSQRTGTFWTTLDTLAAPGDAIDLALSTGLPIPTTAPSPAFSPSAGWVSAWPLGDTGTSVMDRLGRFPGTPTGITSVPGIIGKASSFNGSPSKIVIPGSESGRLELPEKGPYTLSCWARLQSLSTTRFVMGHGALGSNLKFQASLGDSKNSWAAIDFHSGPAGEQFALAPADTGIWTHLAMSVEGDSVQLFINGLPATGKKGFNNSTSPRTAVDFAIGATLDTNGVASRFFLGDLAEAWVHDVVRSPDWIRIVAYNQAAGAPRAQKRP